jgi:putative membrane protein
LATERTMMAWMRTATAMIGFGFTIFQFFDRLNHMAGVAPARNPTLLRLIPLLLIGLGTIGLIIAIAEYRRVIGYLWSDEFKDISGMVKERPSMTPVLTVAVLLVLVGVVALGVLTIRI